MNYNTTPESRSTHHSSNKPHPPADTPAGAASGLALIVTALLTFLIFALLVAVTFSPVAGLAPVAVLDTLKLTIYCMIWLALLTRTPTSRRWMPQILRAAARWLLGSMLALVTTP